MHFGHKLILFYPALAIFIAYRYFAWTCKCP
jgi:hypothetical protein